MWNLLALFLNLLMLLWNLLGFCGENQDRKILTECEQKKNLRNADECESLEQIFEKYAKNKISGFPFLKACFLKA